MSRYYDDYKPYVSVAARRAKAAKLAKKLAGKGQTLFPVSVEGRLIAKSFWGKAWCGNLESYSDFANRLPRGRTYVRNGSVIDLRIRSGEVEAMVSGSNVYNVKIGIQPIARTAWETLKSDCAGQIGSLLELLGGKLSKEIMAVMTRRETGLFPKPKEIRLSCSCPDWAGMCKHVAAALYGIGARLDDQPELLFLLRGVKHEELIEEADAAAAIEASGADSDSVLGGDDLADIFGIELDTGEGLSSGDKQGVAVAEAEAVFVTTVSEPAKPAERAKKADTEKAKKAVRGRKGSPTPTQIRRIRTLAAAGKSSLAISRETGISYPRVLRIVKSGGG